MPAFRTLMICSALACATSASAGRIEIPLRVSLETLREALSARLSASPYRDGPCRYLQLASPKLAAVDGRLNLSGPGTGALGAELAGKCQTAAAWQGSVHITLMPQIDGAGRLRLRILDSRLGDARGGAASLIWDMSKRQVHPRLEGFAYDLGASREQIAALLRSAVPPMHSAAMEQALQDLQILQPRVETAHVLVPIALEIPDAWLAAPPLAVAQRGPLTEAELAALEKTLEPLDAFLLYVVKQAARDGDDRGLRRRLFTLLLDSRYQLAALLSGDAPGPGDPVRVLFLDTWSELRAILVDAQREGILAASLLRYAAFVDAADALAALEAAAPSLALSADGLRLLARNLRPGESADPLAFDWARDGELGRLFDIADIPESDPQPSPPARSWLDLLVTSANADSAPPLDHWVPSSGQLASYETRVGGLLQKTAGSELQRASLATPYDAIYRNLMPTTALIESCWRQYVVRAGKVSYLRSQAGSVGIMQINQRVWRGFYDIERVRWDTAYNVRAGAQILMRYLKDYAIPFAERTGDVDHVARAAYAVYNAGPRAVGRFTKSPPHPREARVDEKLWTLYQGIAAGGKVDLASCSVKPVKTVGR